MDHTQIKTSSSGKRNGAIVVFMLVLAVFYIAIQMYMNVLLGWHANQYAELSKSFLQGNVFFSTEYVERVSAWDMTYSNGKYYWPLGPFPAVALMPIVAFDEVIPLRSSQSMLNIIFALIAAYTSYHIARRIGYSENDSSFWAIAISLGSIFIGVSTFSSSWYLAHTISVALVLVSLLEYLGKRRPLLIGIMMAAVLASRATAGLGIIFFGIAYLFEQGSWRLKVKKIALLILPFLVCILLLSFYNFVRFGSFSDVGYGQQLIPETIVVENRDTKGLFSIEHIQRNLTVMLFGTPQLLTRQDGLNRESTVLVFNPQGMSIFIMAPWLLAAFVTAYRKQIHWQLLITMGFIAGVILLWHSTGCVQLGYRLALDFLPYGILAFMLAYFEKHKYMSTRMKIVIALAVIFNIFLVLTSIFVIPDNTICSL